MIRRSIFCLSAFVLFAAVALGGCTDSTPIGDHPPDYCAQTSEIQVLNCLQNAYTSRNGELYASLLADDYHLWADPADRSPEIPENLNRFQDSTVTATLFRSDTISDIHITLTHSGQVQPVDEPGRERWTHISAVANIEIDQKPDSLNPQGLIFRITDQPQDFYFRRGWSEADTFPASPTSRTVFLVEWSRHGPSWLPE